MVVLAKVSILEDRPGEIRIAASQILMPSLYPIWVFPLILTVRNWDYNRGYYSSY